MAKSRRVAVLIETSRAYGRGLLRGVARYNHEHGQWAVYFTPHGLDEPPPAWLRNWKGDGILARIANRRMADAILKTGLPAVELRGALSGLGLPFIGVDNRIVAQLALRHLVECGLRQFGFCGLRRGEYERMDERCDHFVELTQAAGYPCDVFKATPLRRRGPGDIDRKGLAKWVKGLPKPVGIMVCNDDRGLELLDACRHARVPVPEQAAVISVDNDEYLCGFSIPPLSSVDVAPHGIGYEAASLLDRMMAGRAATQQARVIPPGGVVVRQSTDVLATDDATVAQAIEFIQKHACDRIKIADVVERWRYRAPCWSRV